MKIGLALSPQSDNCAQNRGIQMTSSPLITIDGIRLGDAMIVPACLIGGVAGLIGGAARGMPVERAVLLSLLGALAAHWVYAVALLLAHPAARRAAPAARRALVVEATALALALGVPACGAMAGLQLLIAAAPPPLHPALQSMGLAGLIGIGEWLTSRRARRTLPEHTRKAR